MTRQVCIVPKWAKNNKEPIHSRKKSKPWRHRKLSFLIGSKLLKAIRKKPIHPWSAWSPLVITTILSATISKREKYRKCLWHNNLWKLAFANNLKVSKKYQIRDQAIFHMCLVFQAISVSLMASWKSGGKRIMRVKLIAKIFKWMPLLINLKEA